MTTSSNQVLLTVSGSVPAGLEQEIAQGERPRTDYIAIADQLGADLLDYERARQKTGRLGQLIERIAGSNLMLTYACFRLRHQYRVILTDGEQIGIPLAGFLKLTSAKKRPRHAMLVHILSVPKKAQLISALRLYKQIDQFLVYSTWQQRFIQQKWGLPDSQVLFTPFMVDADFFNPQQVKNLDSVAKWLPAGSTPVIFSLGREFRDYPTLIEAVRGLDAHLVVVAGSYWSKRADTTQGQDIPQNVTLVQDRLSYEALRALYHASSFVVVPLYNVYFQAGITSILEAMAMEKAVVCTNAPGQTDVVIQAQTGLYAEPGDVASMRSAIEQLLSDPQATAQMGQAGRQIIDNEMNLNRYVERLDQLIHGQGNSTTVPSHSSPRIPTD